MLLEVSDLVAGYDGSRVLDGVSLSVDAGESVAVLGRNGVGKTTLINSIMGLVRPSSGSVRVDGTELARRLPHAMARAGVSIVPQGRRVFSSLTVDEHLAISARKGEWTPASVLALMPRLGERRGHLGSQLSGGEQEMLAIGRALVGNPRLLLLDEPSDGLAPTIVAQVGEVLTELASTGVAVLLVEQDLRLAFKVAQRVLVMQKGEIVHRSTVADFRADGQRAQALLGVG
ncbi:ABC transporter ATP-binding protein [Enemella evansiae]|uniref:ABC transporter ATP-binding protein n=1 Tax=Enemella evansiae TaxID=2016499 RepID=A0A255GD53_9ACTN|nr:ABC transporter ATP-binding protein [Enemella evansiae]OYN95494.1 ABC transporter ATP-binding protein [Enemella evansiae]OYO10026.1 ABC transporter ATP-binding protein [Enemella evansiae]OYO13372.1 ABC transporter ATP-binding protein [Enemella evansiae]OYO18894.1 ABC transporter ATP-binding protein [Enemella evansiae]TDO87623.1 amino acid/amide ABC transporter ATP-binding protein 2 (HAAT family) [Enemella evansiae]